MLNASKVFLVRCPKCENLLQEPTESSVYHCGGCGTVLRATKKGNLDNEDLDVSDEQKTKNPYSGFLSFENKFQEFMSSKQVLNPRNTDRTHLLSTSSNPNSTEPRRTFPKFSYPDEGPSYHGIGSYGTYTEQAMYKNQLDTHTRVEILENDRAELLKKLDLLAGMLKNTNNPVDEPRETKFRDPRMPPDYVNSYNRNESINSYGVSKQPISGHSYMPPGHGYDSNIDRHGSYLPRNPIHEYRGFGDVYNLQKPNNYIHGSCYENTDSFMPEPNVNFHHKPTSSCMHDHDNNLYVSSKLQPPNFRDLSMEADGFGHIHKKNPIVTQRDLHVIRPFASGAPFIVCLNCFEVLKMPRKFTLTKEAMNMIKCGACSSVLVFEFENKGMILFAHEENEQESDDIYGDKYKTHDQDFRHPNTWVSNTSDEYRNFTYLEDDEPKTNLDSQISDHDVDEFGHDVDELGHDDHNSLSSMASVDDPIPDGVGEVSSNLGHSPRDKKTSRQNSLNDALVPTEMDVSYDDTPIKGADQCSSDTSKNNVQPRINKMAEAFIKGFIRKSFGDFSKSKKITESRRSRVSINDRVISNWIIKKAEKLAGPIQPGDYWYDYNAGFWGVMGHPCLGIILPNIDEFNYPMPEGCGGGNTEIFLNGRELHQKDLELLSSRGLPTTKHKSYIIQISGIAVDEDTGEELDLGKLAPTVEIAQHGFGMKVPRSLRKQ